MCAVKTTYSSRSPGSEPSSQPDHVHRAVRTHRRATPNVGGPSLRHVALLDPPSQDFRQRAEGNDGGGRLQRLRPPDRESLRLEEKPDAVHVPIGSIERDERPNGAAVQHAPELSQLITQGL